MLGIKTKRKPIKGEYAEKITEHINAMGQKNKEEEPQEENKVVWED